MNDGPAPDVAGGSAAERLAQLRGRTLDLWLVVTFVTRLVPVVTYGSAAWRTGNVPFLVTSAFELVTYTALLAGRRLPLRVRAWGFSLVWILVFAAYLPRGVYVVPVVNAVTSAVLASLLIGPRAGVGLVLAILGLLATSALLPTGWVEALQFGPPHPARPDPPLIVAAGLVPLVAAPIGLGIILRGLLAALAEAQVHEERFRGLIQASPEAIAVVEMPSFRHQHVNPAFEALFGLPAAEVVGRTPVELGVLRAEEDRLLRARLEKTTTVTGLVLPLRRRDGSALLLEMGLQRTELAGSPVVVVIMREVSAQRRFEAVVRQIQRVESMGTLAGGIAHNFRNALGTILPNLDYCLERADARTREPLEDARSAASAAVDLATRLTRMVHQGGGGEREPVALHAVLADVIGIARSTFGARVAIEEAIDVPGAVLADRGELHQVFLNLLLNARDALADAPAPRIKVTLTRSPDGNRLVVAVADNGCGMDPAALQRIGEPFFTTKPPGKGTGLGLFSAFAAVRESGGRLKKRNRKDGSRK